jgi:hypothetical protein
MTVKLLDTTTGAAFFQRELEYIKTAAYDVKYADIRWRSFFPTASDAAEWQDSIVFQTMDEAGEAKVVQDYAKDFPRVDVAASERTAPIKRIGDSFGYNLDELNRSNATGKQLPTKKASLALKVIERKFNNIVWYGEAASGLEGFQTNTDVPRANAANPGAGTTWAVKTPDQILADVNAGFAAVPNTSKGVHTASRMVLPILQYTDIATRRLTDTGMTVLNFIVANSPFIASADQIMWANELDSFGTAGVDDMWIYEPDPMNLEVEVPLEPMIHSDLMETHGLEFTVPCSGKIAGLKIHYPASMILIEGI